jgi:hypothetical protein
MSLLRAAVVVAVITGVSSHAAETGPQGRFTKGVLTESRLFPGARHEYQVYVPAGYTAATPAALMVFQDGAAYAKPDGAFRAAAAFDALIDKGAMPVTVAVFVNPGVVPPTRDGAKPQSIRSFEYDSLSDRYVRFLIEELLPVALQDLNVSAEPAQRAICGMSSGGICAFTAAWQRPLSSGHQTTRRACCGMSSIVERRMRSLYWPYLAAGRYFLKRRGRTRSWQAGVSALAMHSAFATAATLLESTSPPRKSRQVDAENQWPHGSASASAYGTSSSETAQVKVVDGPAPAGSGGGSGADVTHRRSR